MNRSTRLDESQLRSVAGPESEGPPRAVVLADDPDVRELGVWSLRAAGWDATAVADPEEAETRRALEPGVLVVDLRE